MPQKDLCKICGWHSNCAQAHNVLPPSRKDNFSQPAFFAPARIPSTSFVIQVRPYFVDELTQRVLPRRKCRLIHLHSPFLNAMTTSQKKYWAFISYSSRDKAWARWLHRRIERYSIPKDLQGIQFPDGTTLGGSLRPVFRDRDELAGSSELGESLHRALRQSRYLIVICSPNAARSQWVEKEIEVFQSLHGPKNVLALIVDGEPNAISSSGFEDHLECFPPSLRVPNEPLASDLRPSGDGKERGLLKVISGLAQVGFDDLYRRHERAQRRRRRAIATLSGTIILTLSVLTWFAFYQKGIADTERGKAVEQRRVAEIRLADGLLSQANHAMEKEDWWRAKKRFSEARELYQNNSLDTLATDVGLALANAESPSASLSKRISDKPITQLKVLGFGSDIAIADAGGNIRILQLKDRTVSNGPTHDASVLALFETARQQLITLSIDGELISWSHQNDPSSAERQRIVFDDFQVTAATPSPDAQYLYFSCVQYDKDKPPGNGGEAAKITSLIQRISIDAIDESPEFLFASEGWTYDLAVSPSGDSLLLGIPDQSIHVSMDGKMIDRLSELEGRPLIGWHAVEHVEFIDDHTAICICSNGMIERWDLRSGERNELRRTFYRGITDVVAEDGDAMFGCGDGGLRLLSGDFELFGGDAPVSSLCLHKGTVSICAGYVDGTVARWDLDSTRPNRTTLTGDDIFYFTFDFTESGERFLALGAEGTVAEFRNASDGETTQQIDLPFAATTARFVSEDQIVIGGADGALSICGSDGVTRQLDGHESDVLSAAVSGVSLQLISASTDGNMLTHDLNNGNQIASYSIPAKLTHVAFDDAGDACVSTKSGNIELYRANGQKRWSRTVNQYGDVRSLAISKDWVVTGHAGGPIVVWRQNDGELHRVINGHSTQVVQMNFMPAGRHLMSAERAGEFKVWQVEDGLELSTFGLMPVLGFQLSRQGTLVSGVMGDQDTYGDVDIVLRHFGANTTQ